MRRRTPGTPGPARFPDATTTGVTDWSLLPGTPTPGNVVSTTPGQVIENVHVAGQIRVNHANVTVHNCRVLGEGVDNCIEVQANGTGAIIEDCELGPNGPLAAENLVGIGGVRNDTTLRRLNIHHVRDGAFIGSGTIEDSFIHHIGVGRGLPSHHDGVQMTKGDLGPTVIRHNSVVTGVFDGMNAAIFAKADVAPIGGLVVEENYLEGGGYSLFVAPGPTHGWPASVTVRNNTFGRNAMYGSRQFGPGTVETGSRWLDGSAVTAPSIVPDPEPEEPTPAAAVYSVVLNGDSITEQNGRGDATNNPALSHYLLNARGWWTWCSIFSKQKIKMLKNSGVGGESMSTIKARVATDIATYQPDAYIYSGGTNDAAHATNTPEQSHAHWVEGAEAALAAGVQLIVTTAPAQGKAGTYGYSNTQTELAQTKLLAINELRRQWVATHPEVLLVDWFAATEDTTYPEHAKAGTMILADGTHPIALGAYVMGKALYEGMVDFGLIPAEEVPRPAALNTNPLMTGTGGIKGNAIGGLITGTVPDTYRINGETTALYCTTSQVDRAAGGKWLSMEITEGGGRLNLKPSARWSLASLGLVPGDVVALYCEVQTPNADWTSVTGFILSLMQYAAASGGTQIAPTGAFLQPDSGTTFHPSGKPFDGIGAMLTPAVPLHATAQYLDFSLTFGHAGPEGRGTLWVSDLRVIKVS